MLCSPGFVDLPGCQQKRFLSLSVLPRREIHIHRTHYIFESPVFVVSYLVEQCEVAGWLEGCTTCGGFGVSFSFHVRFI